MMLRPSTRPEENLIARLRALGRLLRAYALLDALALTFSVGLMMGAATLVMDRTFRLERDMRAVQLLSCLTALALILRYGLKGPLMRRLAPADLAALVERRFPGLQGRLVTAVEAAEASGRAEAAIGLLAGASPALLAEVSRQAASAMRGLRLGDLAAHGRAAHSGLVILACVGAVSAAVMAAPATASIWARRNLLLAEVPWPTRHRLAVENLVDGRLVAARGDDLTVIASVVPGHEPPRQAFIEYRAVGAAVRRAQMPAVGRDRLRFTHTFEGVSQSLRCRVVGGDAMTEWFDIEVVDRPALATLSLRILPPAYTGEPPRELSGGLTAVVVLRGSVVEFHFTAAVPLSRAALIARHEASGDVRTLEAVDEAGAFRVRDRPMSPTTYDILLRDMHGIENAGPRAMPPRLLIRPVPDGPPQAALRVRGAGELITPQAVLPLEAVFSDRYGLASAAVAWAALRGEQDASFAVEPLPDVARGTRSLSRTLDWSAEAHGLVPGDRLRLKAVAADLDDVGGPNTGESPVLAMRVVADEELLADLNRRQAEHRQDLERLLRGQENLYDELLEALAAGAAPDAALSQSLARRQREAARRADVVRLQFERILTEFEVNRLNVPGIRQRLGGGVIAPLEVLGREAMPRAAADIQRWAAGEAAGGEVRASQEQVLAGLRAVLAALADWESYNEAVTLLREVLRMQGELRADVERRIQAEILGLEPADAPPASAPATESR